MGVFLSRLFFLSSKGRRRRSTDIPFRNNRENRRKKSYATHTRRGPISIKLFPTHNTPTPSIKGGKNKREIEHQTFSQYFKSQRPRNNFLGEICLKKVTCLGKMSRWEWKVVLSRGHFQVCMQLNPTSSLIWRVAMIAINRVLQKQKQAPKHEK